MTPRSSIAAGLAVVGLASVTWTVLGYGAPDKSPSPRATTVLAGEMAVVAGDELTDLLGGVDYVPPRNVLDDVLGEQAASQLIVLARDDEGGTDPGVRIRAYRALADYPGSVTETVLADALVTHGRPGADGLDTVYLRAAMYSLASIAGSRAVDRIRPLLDHDSKDVRAAAAEALAVTGAPSAVAWLRKRLDVETDLMVRDALQEAIRDLFIASQ